MRRCQPRYAVEACSEVPIRRVAGSHLAWLCSAPVRQCSAVDHDMAAHSAGWGDIAGSQVVDVAQASHGQRCHAGVLGILDEEAVRGSSVRQMKGAPGRCRSAGSSEAGARGLVRATHANPGHNAQASARCGRLVERRGKQDRTLWDGPAHAPGDYSAMTQGVCSQPMLCGFAAHGLQLMVTDAKRVLT